MHAVVAALFILPGLGCLAYVLAGESAMEREPPLLALGVLLVAIGAGLALRARAAHLLAQASLVGSMVINVVAMAGPHVVPGAADPADQQLVARLYVFFSSSAGSFVPAWPRPALVSRGAVPPVTRETG